MFYDDINRYVLVLPPMARGKINLNFPAHLMFLVSFESSPVTENPNIYVPFFQVECAGDNVKL